MSKENPNPSRREFIKKAGIAAVALSNLDALSASQTVENKFVNKDGNWEFVFTSPDPGKAHESANVFAHEVGNVLKTAYPSRVLDPAVSLRILMINGQKSYRLAWSCRIVKSSDVDADYYFDRRGTLLSGRTLLEAKNKVETELKNSAKVPEMRKKFGNRGKIYETFIKDSFAGSDREGYWYIKEFFMVVPK